MKYLTPWAPYARTIICLLMILILLMGCSIGFAIHGLIIDTLAVTNESCDTNPCVVPPQTSAEETEVTEETEAPGNTYYNCPLSYELQDYIRELCDENGLPMSLVIALIEIESSFRASVISGTNDYGLMQINTCNHEWLSEKYGITDFLDPYQNVFCGITILSQHYNRFQDENKALMAYNLGATGAKRWWDKGVYETKYTQKIQSAKARYENEIE